MKRLDMRDHKTFHVTVKVVREYSATINIRARSQVEAEKIALDEYDRWRCDQEVDSKYYAGICLGFPPPWNEHESIDHDPEIDRHFHCVDCGRCTSSLGQYYMVSDELWAASGLAPNDGMLCLRDLERRIGRELTLDDFTAIRPTSEAWERHVASRRASSADLANDLYIQLREVERCLERYPDQLPEAVRRLIGLVHRYNPELFWTDEVSPIHRMRVARMGESDRF